MKRKMKETKKEKKNLKLKDTIFTSCDSVAVIIFSLWICVSVTLTKRGLGDTNCTRNYTNMILNTLMNVYTFFCKWI